jgi:hypothetical protein
MVCRLYELQRNNRTRRKGVDAPREKIGQKIAEMENRYRAIGIAYLTEKE